MPAAFRCPQCRQCALKINAHLEIPGDRDWDEITLQMVSCSNCGLGALGVYQEARRGRLDSETWSHTCYRLDPQDVLRVAAIISSCPRPYDSSCLCSAHLELGLTNSKLQWDGIAHLPLMEYFKMEICS